MEAIRILLMMPGFHFNELTSPCPQWFRGKWKVRTCPGDSIMWWQVGVLCLGPDFFHMGL